MKNSKVVTKTKNQNKKVEATPAKLYAPTITREKKFQENPHFFFSYTKNECLEYLKSHPDLKLFGEDYDNQKSKRFLAIDEETIYFFSSTRKFFLYEYLNYQKIKLFMDIDIYDHQVPKDRNSKEYFDEILKESINMVNIQLQKYDVYNPAYIILHSNKIDKKSAHIIFPDIIFQNHVHLRFFFMQFEIESVKNNHIDMSVYGDGCLRILGNGKFPSNITFEFYKAYNYKVKNNKEFFMDCLITHIQGDHQLIPIKIPNDIKIICGGKKNLDIKKSVNKNQKIGEKDISSYDTNIIFMPIENLSKYVNLLSEKRSDDYYTWMKVGM